MNKIIKVIIDIILILAIILLAGYFILRIAGIIRIYNVETGSMEDKIHAGDYILLCKRSNYQIGDVVTYIEDNYYVTHRIVKMDGDIITTKGDANNVEDQEINKDQIAGKMIISGGILNIVIKFKYAFIAFLIGLYLVSCYIQEEKEDKKKNKK
jgi:signal peptidase I